MNFSKENKYQVYILMDPRTTTKENQIRYVGQTKQKLHKRLCQHITKTKSKSQKQRYVNFWIKELLCLGLEPLISCMALCSTRVTADKKEKYYIRQYKEQGYRLCNLTSGGGGHFEMSEETRRKIGAAHKKEKNHFYGKHHTSASKLKISLAKKGQTAWNKNIPAADAHMAIMRFYANETEAREKQILAVAKTFQFLDPYGVVTTITNLNKFCKENNLSVSAMNDLYHGVRHRKSHKGWRRLPPTLP